MLVPFFPYVQNLKNNCLKTVITCVKIDINIILLYISISYSLELLAVIQIYNTGTYCSELFFSWHKYGNMVLLSFCLASCACSCCPEFHVRKWFSCNWSGKYEKSDNAKCCSCCFSADRRSVHFMVLVIMFFSQFLKVIQKIKLWLCNLAL
jgi:hypothetical protein